MRARFFYVMGGFDILQLIFSGRFFWIAFSGKALASARPGAYIRHFNLTAFRGEPAALAEG